MTGAFAGKNLILIMMESTDDWLVTPEYMPNLWQMEREGLYFPNYYSPMFLSAGTFNAEFSANTGRIAPEYHVRNSYYTEHALPYSLANLFRDAGYRAQSYHAAAPGIYNRGQIHLNFGYESCAAMTRSSRTSRFSASSLRIPATGRTRPSSRTLRSRTSSAPVP